jgi:hypothetical protein
MAVPKDKFDATLEALTNLRDQSHIQTVPTTARPSLLMFIGITTVLFFVAVALSEMASYFEIVQNWEHYRCNPGVIPFARFYGHSLEETMSFCIGEAVREHAPGVIDPMYSAINGIMTVVDGVYEKASAVEGGVTSLLGGFEKFLMQFANSLRLVGTRVRMSLVRIRDIFSRVYASFISIAFAGISAVTFGQNLIYNPLVAFIDDIGCFAPDMRIALPENRTAAIRDITIGDRLRDGSTVTSTYRFDGRKTRMVRLHGIHVSGNHSLLGGKRADEHPDAVPAESVDVMLCIATTNHRIPVVTCSGDRVVTFTDYEESSDPQVIAEAQRAAEVALGDSVGETVPDFSLGLDPNLYIGMYSGSWKRLDTLELGDRLARGADVVGIIRETCATCVKSPAGNVFSAAQLIRCENGWKRAAYVYPAISGEYILHHVIVSDNSSLYVYGNTEFLFVRDYAEYHDHAVQSPYDAILRSSDFRTPNRDL